MSYRYVNLQESGQCSTSRFQQGAYALRAVLRGGNVQRSRVHVLHQGPGGVKATVHGGGDHPGGARLQPAAAIQTCRGQEGDSGRRPALPERSRSPSGPLPGVLTQYLRLPGRGPRCSGRRLCGSQTAATGRWGGSCSRCC